MNRKRNHLGASLAFAIAILGFGVSAQAQKAPRRIIFARGGRLRGRQVICAEFATKHG